MYDVISHDEDGRPVYDDKGDTVYQYRHIYGEFSAIGGYTKWESVSEKEFDSICYMIAHLKAKYEVRVLKEDYRASCTNPSDVSHLQSMIPYKELYNEK